LLINASGADPYLVYSSEKCAGEGEIVVYISLSSPDETEMQFYYTTKEQHGFSGAFSRILHVKKGENKLFFRIQYPYIAGKIRIDPGKVAGQYVLHELIINKSSVKPSIH
jgi:hypothetical protein